MSPSKFPYLIFFFLFLSCSRIFPGKYIRQVDAATSESLEFAENRTYRHCLLTNGKITATHTGTWRRAKDDASILDLWQWDDFNVSGDTLHTENQLLFIRGKELDISYDGSDDSTYYLQQ